MVELVAFSKPEIKAEYERRLGAYLIKFNDLEVMLGMLLSSVFEAAGLSPLHKDIHSKSMAVKIDFLSVLQLAPIAEPFAKLNIERLRTVSKARNDFAHGHFAQNLMDGTFQILDANKPLVAKKEQARKDDTPEAKINRRYAEIDAAMIAVTAAEWELSQAYVWSDFATKLID